jgi:hypothetical protein
MVALYNTARGARQIRGGSGLRGGLLYTLIGMLVIIVVMTLLVLLILASINPRFPEGLL